MQYVLMNLDRIKLIKKVGHKSQVIIEVWFVRLPHFYPTIIRWKIPFHTYNFLINAGAFKTSKNVCLNLAAFYDM